MAKCDVMLVCAHPDDQVASVGGTLAKYSEDGEDIHTLILTYGELSQPHLKRKYLSQKVRKECRQANGVMGGGEINFLGLKEGSLQKELEKDSAIKKLEKHIKSHKPKKIFTHKPEDPHPDHRAVGKAVLGITEGMKCSVYGMERMALFNLKNRKYPKLFVDITDTFSTKKKALKEHKTQNLTRFLMWPAIYIRGFLNGWKNETRFAELFHQIK